jgi:hypothetical protein
VSRTANADWSKLVILPADASNAKPQKITDPVRLARLRKMVADMQKYGYLKPPDGEPTPPAAPASDATSPPEPS